MDLLQAYTALACNIGTFGFLGLMKLVSFDNISL